MIITLKAENWLWFPIYRRDLKRANYNSVDE